MKYHVGQIIYVIIPKKGQVYPMMVIEEITKKTLKGEETNYVLQAGSNQASTILMSDLEGEVFTTAKDAKDVLVSRATLQIERIVQNASKKAEEWYNRQQSDEVIHELPEPETEQQMVTLPDGTTARLKFST